MYAPKNIYTRCKTQQPYCHVVALLYICVQRGWRMVGDEIVTPVKGKGLISENARIISNRNKIKISLEDRVEWAPGRRRHLFRIQLNPFMKVITESGNNSGGEKESWGGKGSLSHTHSLTVSLSLSHSVSHSPSIFVSISLHIARRRLLNLIKIVCRPKRRCLARHKSQLSAADGKHNLHVYINTRAHILLSSQINIIYI